jgi:hypothetical protein
MRISDGAGEQRPAVDAGPSLALGAACQAQPGSNRQVSSAIHTIAIIRAKHQPETRACLDRRTAEGKTKRQALRALERQISRDVFKRLNEIALTS